MTDEIQDIKILNIDDVQYTVDSLSDGTQKLVQIYNDWNRKEAKARDELMLVQAAKETLSRQIITRVREEQIDKEGSNKEPEAQPANSESPKQ